MLNLKSVLIITLLIPSFAYASDRTGLLSVMYFLWLAIPFSILHLMIIVYCQIKDWGKQNSLRTYTSRQLANQHLVTSIGFYSLGIVIMLTEYLLSYGLTIREDRINMIILGISAYILLLGIAFIPRLISRLDKTNPSL